jgi:hypothetical protein
MNTTMTAQFKGYETTATNKAGETYGVRVINRRDNVARKDGTIGTLVKVQEIYFRQNPSPFAEKNIKCHHAAVWINADMAKVNLK